MGNIIITVIFLISFVLSKEQFTHHSQQFLIQILIRFTSTTESGTPKLFLTIIII